MVPSWRKRERKEACGCGVWWWAAALGWQPAPTQGTKAPPSSPCPKMRPHSSKNAPSCKVRKRESLHEKCEFLARERDKWGFLSNCATLGKHVTVQTSGLKISWSDRQILMHVTYLRSIRRGLSKSGLACLHAYFACRMHSLHVACMHCMSHARIACRMHVHIWIAGSSLTNYNSLHVTILLSNESDY